MHFGILKWFRVLATFYCVCAKGAHKYVHFIMLSLAEFTVLSCTVLYWYFPGSAQRWRFWHYSYITQWQEFFCSISMKQIVKKLHWLMGTNLENFICFSLNFRCPVKIIYYVQMASLVLQTTLFSIGISFLFTYVTPFGTIHHCPDLFKH